VGGGVQMGPLVTSATECPGWLWLWRIWWNEDWQGKPKYSEKTCPSATLSTKNPTWPDPGSNPGRRGGKSVTNRLSYGAAIITTFLSVMSPFFFIFQVINACNSLGKRDVYPWLNITIGISNHLSYFIAYVKLFMFQTLYRFLSQNMETGPLGTKATLCKIGFVIAQYG
jgi:hypothetical protein